ncbi:uncharacterized protein SPPG_03152 [Spizellomyces punctatus DAOM BR117]|uniref:Uncharacterized protein n=1 Tax=Spizellomyces punctatus (strain DAOM BR117) TaxID=645134 RepID=A0A0L0HKB8_SPIPD|nr:uncharacterized protein SPPG_03152 [Spizellomyces punctatus DAOM BR117]KND01340.1 hypothetical protein SPPG_03152 [Spizellomyces punctatus DAOM BR117]|eukprot:XP_016609379.1 hypothetical protein SPPG_03152 [Spizellomyces punctatus DAOM BR117]
MDKNDTRSEQENVPATNERTVPGGGTKKQATVTSTAPLNGGQSHQNYAPWEYRAPRFNPSYLGGQARPYSAYAQDNYQKSNQYHPTHAYSASYAPSLRDNELPPRVISSSHADVPRPSYPYAYQHYQQSYNRAQSQSYPNPLHLHKPNSPIWNRKADSELRQTGAYAGIPPPAYNLPPPPAFSQKLSGTYETRTPNIITGDTEKDLRDLLSSIPDDDASIDSEHQHS